MDACILLGTSCTTDEAAFQASQRCLGFLEDCNLHGKESCVRAWESQDLQLQRAVVLLGRRWVE